MTTFFDEPESDIETGNDTVSWEDSFTSEPEVTVPEEIP